MVKIVSCIFVIHFPLFSVNPIHLYVDFILYTIYLEVTLLFIQVCFSVNQNNAY